MKKLLLYGHGGAYNHGAEAILRASIPLFRKVGCPIFLSTHFPEQDREFGLDKLVDRLIPADLTLVSQEIESADFEEKEQVAACIYRDALDEIDSETVCIGVGGDNYCYPNWHRQSVFHRTAKERGGQSVLWGCSIQPEMIDNRMESILREHDQIYARESITFDTLQKHGIHQITQLPDPAFSLAPEPLPLPEEFRGSVAGINLSPLMLRRSDRLLGDFAETARFLLKKTDTLLLVSHVTMPVDDDREALEKLTKFLSEEERGRISWIPERANAAQRKYLIAHCKLLVCCRTHASIAGYSTGVPTLVVGYSVKSQGIGLDLGMERWVIPVEDSAKLSERAMELWEIQHQIHANLLAKLGELRYV